MNLEIYTDGACSGNPGPAGIGVVIRDGGDTLRRLSRPIGQATNNIAEYTAVIEALQEALILKADGVVIRTDSELLFRQVTGDYQVKNGNIRPLFEQIQRLRRGFSRFAIYHVPREENREADQLAKQAVKNEQAKAVASEVSSGEKSPGS